MRRRFFLPIVPCSLPGAASSRRTSLNPAQICGTEADKLPWHLSRRQAMFWKTKNGRRYLYRSQRRGGKVVTEYLGTGADAEALFQVERHYRVCAAEWKAVLRTRQELVLQAEQHLDDLSECVSRLTDT